MDVAAFGKTVLRQRLLFILFLLLSLVPLGTSRELGSDSPGAPVTREGGGRRSLWCRLMKYVWADQGMLRDTAPGTAGTDTTMMRCSQQSDSE